MTRWTWIIAPLLWLAAASGDVVVLTDSNFEHLTQASTGQTTGKWFVKFYASWCGHCKRLAPTWKELAAFVDENHADEGIVIAKVDGVANREVTQRFKVKGYPTLAYITGGNFYVYRGERTVQAMAEFCVNGYKGTEGTPVPPLPSWLDQKRKKLSVAVQSNRALSVFIDDFEHILQLRKNAALALLLLGAVVGLVIGLLIGSTSSSKKAKAKKD